MTSRSDVIVIEISHHVLTRVRVGAILEILKTWSFSLSEFHGC